jgi:hypothetical protein
MLIAWKTAIDILGAQQEQDARGHLFEGGRKYLVLPKHGLSMRLWLYLFLPRSLYECIEWTPEGAVFLARKDDEPIQ